MGWVDWVHSFIIEISPCGRNDKMKVPDRPQNGHPDRAPLRSSRQSPTTVIPTEPHSGHPGRAPLWSSRQSPTPVIPAEPHCGHPGRAPLWSSRQSPTLVIPAEPHSGHPGRAPPWSSRQSPTTVIPAEPHSGHPDRATRRGISAHRTQPINHLFTITPKRHQVFFLLQLITVHRVVILSS